ncbi:hypothetical protein FRC11_002096, partial [Ceratobasidium sp. 423]
ATLGLEVVPSLQTQYQPNDTLLNGWWGTRYLPHLMRPDPPPCEPKDIGPGDTFRLSALLFDYKVMSAWGISNASEPFGVLEQRRFRYQGEPLVGCYVNGAAFEYDRNTRTQTIITSMTFSWNVRSNFLGQHYMQRFIQRTSANDYRKLVLAALEVISTDSLTIMDEQHLSNPALTIQKYVLGDPDTGDIMPSSTIWTYLNGTQSVTYLDKANIYASAFLNLLVVSMDAVSLDLGSHRNSTIFTNSSRLHDMITPNRAPTGINASDWANVTKSFNYGQIVPPYQTWAEMLLNDQPVKLGNATGMPEVSSMATTYLCPIYKIKPISSLLVSVFVGTATMFMSVLSVWWFFMTCIAMRIEEPRVYMYCSCDGCKKRKAKAEECQRKGGKEER